MDAKVATSRVNDPERSTLSTPVALQPGDGASLVLYREALGAEHAARTLAELRATLPWEQQSIQIYGKQHLQPRLSCWIGDPEAAYSYSGTRFHPRPWPDSLLRIQKCLETLTGHTFNSVLCNAYRDGHDSMGWHADDEAELGERPVIASYSLGATRSFQMRPKSRPRPSPPWSIELAHDDLVVMSGRTQQLWQHAIPKRLRVKDWRINLTFRWIKHAS
nr:alpha-ketoglutarate-dependent dioxygenase AlkB [Oceanococcus sp. HetDA_MAG_MS8]